MGPHADPSFRSRGTLSARPASLLPAHVQNCKLTVQAQATRRCLGSRASSRLVSNQSAPPLSAPLITPQQTSPGRQSYGGLRLKTEQPTSLLHCAGYRTSTRRTLRLGCQPEQGSFEEARKFGLSGQQTGLRKHSTYPRSAQPEAFANHVRLNPTPNLTPSNPLAYHTRSHQSRKHTRSSDSAPRKATRRALTMVWPGALHASGEPVHRRFVQVKDKRCFYTDTGKGPLVVILSSQLVLSRSYRWAAVTSQKLLNSLVLVIELSALGQVDHEPHRNTWWRNRT